MSSAWELRGGGRELDPAERALFQMKSSLDKVLVAVWQHSLAESADVLKLGPERYLVTRSKPKLLRQVIFVYDGNSIVGIEQNPKIKSR